jgi:hypothetical protein
MPGQKLDMPGRVRTKYIYACECPDGIHRMSWTF